MLRKHQQDGRREDPNNPAWVHRLSISFSHDKHLEMDGKLVGLAVACERPADFAGLGQARLGGSTSLHDLERLLQTLRDAWRQVLSAAAAHVAPNSAVTRTLASPS